MLSMTSSHWAFLCKEAKKVLVGGLCIMAYACEQKQWRLHQMVPVTDVVYQ